MDSELGAKDWNGFVTVTHADTADDVDAYFYIYWCLLL